MRNRWSLLAGVLALLTVSASAAEWHVAWSVELPARKPAWEYTPKMSKDAAYEPVYAGNDLVLVGCDHDGSLRALDAKTGGERWRFYTGAAIRVAPVVDGERIYVGSDDGRLYCLGFDGKVAWTFRGGPADRVVLGHERFMSAWPISARPIVADGKVFCVAGYWPVDGVYVHALDAASGQVVWSTSVADYRPFGVMRIFGKGLFVDGHPSGGAYDLATGGPTDEKKPQPAPAAPKPPQPAPPPPAESPDVKGTVARRVKDEGRMLIATNEGRTYCLTEQKPAQAAPATAAAIVPLATGNGDAFGVSEGYCFVVGLTDGALVEKILRTTKLDVLAIDADAGVVAKVRERADKAGLFVGHRLTVIQGEPESAGLPPYFATLIVSERSDFAFGPNVRECVRPYGGVLVEAGGKVTRRDGPLAGAADWTHEFADPAMTLASKDTRVRGPLGVLWYGGPGAEQRLYFDGGVDHQSGDGLNPQPVGTQILDGRMFLQAPGVLAAVDVYTGRMLWESPLPKVFAFGGKEGGLGVHSKKYPRPWEAPEAMTAEVPPTHRARSSGFNYASTREGLYVAAARSLLRIDPTTGKETARWPVPLPAADAETLCWGSVWVDGDVLVATAFRPKDLADAHAGHDGNGGDWAGDRMPMGYLLAIDRASGKLLWHRQAKWGFLNRGVAVGSSTVFCLDEVMEGVLAKWKESGRTLATTPPTVAALDLRTGKEKWSQPVEVLVKNLHYSAERDTLLLANRHRMDWKDGDWAPGGAPGKAGKIENNGPGRMRGLSGADGQTLWDVSDASYFNPHVLLGDLVIDRNGVTYDLKTGKRATRTSPLTGETEAWSFSKSGCTHLVACAGLVTWRTAYYDLAGHSGAVRLPGMDSGCSPTLLPANGVLAVPNLGTHHKRNRMTAVAMVHRPQNDNWANFATSSGKGGKTDAAPQPPAAYKRLAVSFGAPGDRRDADGMLWLAVNAKPSDTAPARIGPKEARAFNLPPGAIAGHRAAASGFVGVTEASVATRPGGVGKENKKAKPPQQAEEARTYTVRLHFLEPESLTAGQRVFGVALEGNAVLSDLDVARETGGPRRALVKEFRGVKVTGPLDITLTASQGVPVISAVEMVAE